LRCLRPDRGGAQEGDELILIIGFKYTIARNLAVPAL
jgi:hypothetical protein